jgi:hypothetical protein
MPRVGTTALVNAPWVLLPVRHRNGTQIVAASQPDRFVRIASHGFGDPQNSYAFSMAWLKDRLYIGTSRNILQLIKASPPKHPAAMEPWPVEVPPNIFDMDLRAQIWAFSPALRKWEQVYVSPIGAARGRQPAPRDIGYRCMAVVQGKSDPAPALYISTASSSSRGWGAHILRYTPETGVTQISPPGLGNSQVSTFRTLVEFRNRLYTSPAGSGRAWNAADLPCVYESTDPVFGRWRIVSAPHFGDTTNEAMYSMAVFNDRLYVGTLNSDSGFQLWRTDAAGNAPYKWERVLSNGAWRGNFNQAVVSMCVFQGALFIGTGISNGGYDRTRLIGPAAGEVIRLNPDHSWDLVLGESRSTPDGNKHPLSALGPGFGNPYAGYIWSMVVHKDVMYVGTFDSTVFLLWADPKRAQTQARAQLNNRDLARFAQQCGGFDLWRSDDGIRWVPISRNGFHNPYNYGIRTMASTPAGLFVGTANPFGPKVATKVEGKWKYVLNPRSGLEVWLEA